VHLLLAEIALAVAALRRGWRIAPALLVAAGGAALMWSPDGLASAIAHGLALVALVAACSSDPHEPLARPPRRGPRTQRRGPLYQI
jgi:hypothetical protein